MLRVQIRTPSHCLLLNACLYVQGLTNNRVFTSVWPHNFIGYSSTDICHLIINPQIGVAAVCMESMLLQNFSLKLTLGMLYIFDLLTCGMTFVSISFNQKILIRWHCQKKTSRSGSTLFSKKDKPVASGPRFNKRQG